MHVMSLTRDVTLSTGLSSYTDDSSVWLIKAEALMQTGFTVGADVYFVSSCFHRGMLSGAALVKHIEQRARALRLPRVQIIVFCCLELYTVSRCGWLSGVWQKETQRLLVGKNLKIQVWGLHSGNDSSFISTTLCEPRGIFIWTVIGFTCSLRSPAPHPPP